MMTAIVFIVGFAMGAWIQFEWLDMRNKIKN